MISHRARLLLLYAMAVEYGCYSQDDRFLAITPLRHWAGITFALAPLYFQVSGTVRPGGRPEYVFG